MEVVERLKRFIDVKVIHDGKPWIGTSIWVLKTALKLRKLKKDEPSIIHAANFRAALPPALAEKKFVLTFHDVAPMRMYKFRGYLQRLAARKAAAIITPTNAVREALLREAPNVADKVRVIPNGVDCRKFKPILKEKSEKPTIGYVGRRAAYKVSLIPRIVRLLPSYYRFKFAEGDLDDTQLCIFYNSCHLILVSSPPYAEGFSLVTVEALACGTPVVATDNPAIREIVNGYAFYSRYEVEEFVKKIRWVIENYDDARKKALEGRKYVDENLDWDKTAAMNLKLYKELL
ncbi:glycosyltransferase family 4 protein [Candidatus Hecatella orcuttiae]|uniref:glycosyltransferase family 4 protein n=1 Tax=Candidatus Hecatella orcuttiae TaxID=1935119 RepID=UPI002867F7DC|nr:glycosyltransferase family 4 protein [Candidatus Hecatella orcuttiae]